MAKNIICPLVLAGVLLLLPYTHAQTANYYTISGLVTATANGELLIGVNVVAGNQNGTTSNTYGFYSITLEEGEYEVAFSSIGYLPQVLSVKLNKDVRLDVALAEKTEMLQEVTVYSAESNENLSSPIAGFTSLSARQVLEIPALMGEPDLIRAIKLLPGVQMTNETSSGFTVRGGARDQNLILLDEATVYNASHLMGIFSVFNANSIKNVNFYKGYIPSQFGGRLASTLDVRMKEGSTTKPAVSGGIGLISSHFQAETPYLKKKASLMVAARRTYADLFLPISSNEEVKDSKLYFYDLNLKTSFLLNKNNRILLAGYFGRDFFKYAGREVQPEVDWGNSTFSARWNHIISQKHFSNFSFIISNYQFSGFTSSVISQFNNATGQWKSDLQDHSVKIDLSYFPSPNFTLNYGMQSVFHRYQPGSATLIYDNEEQFQLNIPGSRALENALYADSELAITPKLTLSSGIRLSMLSNIGEATVYDLDYDYKVTDTTFYRQGEFYNHYFGPEPRISLSYQPNELSSVKISGIRTRQYVQVASNSTAGTPIDAWIPSSPNLKPQIADQFSAGYFRNFGAGNLAIESSLEIYYKRLYNQIDYKDHADLLFTENIESQLRTGEGNAYGIELMIKKTAGNLNGWISYTLSKSRRLINGINNNQQYLSPYDRPHNVAVTSNARISERLTLSATFTYISGAPFTSPTGRYKYGNVVLPVYSDRNGDRLPDYHRADIGLTLKNRKKEGRRWESDWNLSVYNVYSRKNPTTIYFASDFFDRNTTTATIIYVLPVLPALSYNFKF